jgi:hypothetical protein
MAATSLRSATPRFLIRQPTTSPSRGSLIPKPSLASGPIGSRSLYRMSDWMKREAMVRTSSSDTPQRKPDSTEALSARPHSCTSRIETTDLPNWLWSRNRSIRLSISGFDTTTRGADWAQARELRCRTSAGSAGVQFGAFRNMRSGHPITERCDWRGSRRGSSQVAGCDAVGGPQSSR